KMHGTSMPLHAGGQCLLVSMQAWKRWKQRRMNVYQPLVESFNEAWRQHAHETRQQNVMRPVFMYCIGQCLIEELTRFIVAMRHYLRCDAARFGPCKAGSIGIVRHHCTNVPRGTMPIQRFDYSFQV